MVIGISLGYKSTKTIDKTYDLIWVYSIKKPLKKVVFFLIDDMVGFGWCFLKSYGQFNIFICYRKLGVVVLWWPKTHSVVRCAECF